MRQLCTVALNKLQNCLMCTMPTPVGFEPLIVTVVRENWLLFGSSKVQIQHVVPVDETVHRDQSQYVRSGRLLSLHFCLFQNAYGLHASIYPTFAKVFLATGEIPHPTSWFQVTLAVVRLQHARQLRRNSTVHPRVAGAHHLQVSTPPLVHH